MNPKQVIADAILWRYEKIYFHPPKTQWMTMIYLRLGSGFNKQLIRSSASGMNCTKKRFFRFFTILISRSRCCPNGCFPPVIQKKRMQPKLNISTARVWRPWTSCSGACQPELPPPASKPLNLSARRINLLKYNRLRCRLWLKQPALFKQYKEKR